MIGALRVEQPKWRGLGLMFVVVNLNRREVTTLVDIWAIYSFVFTKVSNQLGLKSMVSTNKIKAVNLSAK